MVAIQSGIPIHSSVHSWEFIIVRCISVNSRETVPLRSTLRFDAVRSERDFLQLQPIHRMYTGLPYMRMLFMLLLGTSSFISKSTFTAIRRKNFNSKKD